MKRHLIAFGSVLALTSFLVGMTRESQFVMGDMSGSTRILGQEVLAIASSSRSVLASVAREPSGEVDGACLSLKFENDRVVVEVRNLGSQAVELRGATYSPEGHFTPEEPRLATSSLEVDLYQGQRPIQPQRMCGFGYQPGYSSLAPGASVRKDFELKKSFYMLVPSSDSVIQARIRLRDGRELYSNVVAFPVLPEDRL